jgi:hypothetical protein
MAFLPTLALLLQISPANAQACDTKALKAQIADASPRAVADLFLQLADCDVKVAQQEAPGAFQKILSGPEGVQAAVAAVRVGAAQPVRDWIEALISDERAATLAGLGAACSQEPTIVSFFVQSHDLLGDRFWRDRWHRGLSECRTPEIQDLLRKAFQEEPVQKDSSRFGSILEVYCSNARREAIPWLKALMFTTHEENQLHIMGAFANAAGVGTPEGMDAEAAAESISSILDVAPQLPPKVVEQARITLESLGAMQEADELAAVRYADRRQPDGRFMWGAIAVETATCKKGETRIGVWSAPVYESGHRWPDQMHDPVVEAVDAGWGLDLAKKCKGTSTTEVLVSPHPFLDAAEWTAWRDEQLREIRKRPSTRTDESEAAAPMLP